MIESNFTQDISALKKLPNSWSVIDFGEVFTDISGGNKKFLKSDFLVEGKVAVVDQGKDLIAGYTNEEDEVVKGQPPYIVFGDHTRIFKYIDFPFVMGADGTKVFKVKDITINDEKYLFHFLNSLNIPNTGYNRHFKYLKSTKIPLPPLPQQQKIANILDAADALRQNDKALIAKYDELTQALFLDMFGDVISNSKNWESKKFEEIISLKRGYDLPNNDRKKGDIPVVASTGIVGYHNEVKVKGGCIVTGRSGSIGKVQLITVDCWPLNTSLYGYKTFNNNLVYLKYFVSYFRIDRFSHGAGVPTLDRKLVHKELAPFPPLELQNQFAKQVALIEEQKAIAQKSLEHSESLFNSLLKKAFKGELA